MTDSRPLPLSDSAARADALEALPCLASVSGWSARYGSGLVWDEAEQMSVRRERVLIVDVKRNDEAL